jgi:hypothetical protein
MGGASFGQERTMFRLFKKKSSPPPNPKPAPDPALRARLFGDSPIEEWLPQRVTEEPWARFARAARCMAANDEQGAKQMLLEITELPALESLQLLQAWHFLRPLGVEPPALIAKKVYGGIVEVHLVDGLDLVAAYQDGSARYIDHAGAIIASEPGAQTARAETKLFLAACQAIANAIGPWDGPRPDVPKKGFVRINLLTPSGLHYGEGPLDAMSGDGLGGPAIHGALSVMKALIAKTGQPAPA